MGCGVSRARSRAQARLERECQEEYGGQGQAPLTRYVSPASKNLITREGSFKVQEKIDHRAVGVSVSFAASFSSRSYSSHPHIVTSHMFSTLITFNLPLFESSESERKRSAKGEAGREGRQRESFDT